MTDVFVLVHDRVALAGLDREGHDLVIKAARLLRGLGLVLRSKREFVLLVATDLPFLGDVFGRGSHVIVVEGIPQAVADHGVDELHVTHLLARTKIGRMGGHRHAFLAARQHHRGIARRYLLGGQGNGPQSRPADLVQKPGRGFGRQARVDMRLSRRVLALARGQDLAQDRFGNFGRVDPGPGHDFLQDRCAQVMRGDIGERSQKAADGSACGGNDYGFGHSIDPFPKVV